MNVKPTLFTFYVVACVHIFIYMYTFLYVAYVFNFKNK